MDALLQDLRFAVRTFARRPGVAIAAILTLALGVGASTAVFNLAMATLFPKLPVHEPDRLAAIFQYEIERGMYSPLSYPAYTDYSERLEAFSGLAAYTSVPLNLTSGGRSQRVAGELVSASYFSLLGVRPVIGRGFVAGEDREPGAHPVAVISHALWRREFGADPAVVGGTFRLNGHSFTVVGIAPERFRGLELGSATEVWIPLSMRAQALPHWRETFFYNRGTHWLQAVGRLEPGVELRQAEEEARALAAALAEEFPDEQADWTARLLPISEAGLWPAVRYQLTALAAMLLALTGLIVVLACANVANVLLGRIAARREELAVRLALGAGGSRLVRQLLAETVVLSVPAGLAGLLAAIWISDVLPHFPLSRFLPAGLELGPDLRTVLFLLLLTVAVTFLTGLVPAIQASRQDLSLALRAGATGRVRTPRGARLRSSLSVAQIALALVVLACAAVLGRSALRQLDVELGFEPDRVALLSLDLALSGYHEDDGAALYGQILARARAVPGVTSASAAYVVPLGWYRYMTQVAPSDAGPGAEQARSVTGNVVAPGYFETLGIPILHGRAFDGRDADGAPMTVVVSSAMARRFWPGDDPIGKRIRFPRKGSEDFEVVGVAGDIQHGRSPVSSPGPFFYLPLYQHYQPSAILHVKTMADPRALIPSIRAAVADLDPDLPLYDVHTLEQHVHRATLPAFFIALAVTGLGTLGLALAAIGIYGVISHAVVSRTNEIGVRLALGAEPQRVLRYVFRHGLKLLGVGVVIGAAAAVAAIRVLGGSLTGVSAADPIALALAAAFTTAISLLAVYIPARRATRIDPALALRAE